MNGTANSAGATNRLDIPEPAGIAERRDKGLPRVFIVGGGFGGLAAARALAKAPVDVIVLDRRNYHLFQPLLYQVAAAVLSPADIAAPIRYILRRQQNCRVALIEVKAVDLARKRILFERASVEYDWLVLAAGATHSYFGKPEWAAIAPGLKTLEDGIELRRRILLAFETAEYEGHEASRTAALTFAIVGGGPTGVELAGAVKEIAARSIPADFRNIDTKTARVILLQGGDRLLPQFHPKLSERAKRDLESMGVEVRLNANVTNVTKEGVYVGQEFLPARNIFWAAGVRGSPIAETLCVPCDRSGRVKVAPDLSVPGDRQTFVIGDLADATSADTGKPVPGVAQAAMQMGDYVGRIIRAECSGAASPTRAPFKYRDKGSMATIGRARAVAQIGRARFGGFFAWLLWGVVHIMSLVSFRDRIAVVFNWLWNWIAADRSARLITGDASLDIETPRVEDNVLLEPPTPQPVCDAPIEAKPAATQG